MTTATLDGERAQIRRNLAANRGSYSEVTRAAMSSVVDPLDFLADQNVKFYNLMMWDVMEAAAFCMLQGTKFNPEEYYDRNPTIYRKSHVKFKTSSRDGYYIGRDFLTNQPIFVPYKQ